MACLNVALVSSLILASHGLFVNNTATENQVTSPLEHYPAGSAPESPEDLQLLNDIFGTTAITSEFPPRNSTLESNALIKSVTSPLEHYPAGSAPGSAEDLQLLNDIFGTTPKTSKFPPRYSTLESNASLKSVTSPLEHYPAASAPGSPEDLQLLNDIFGMNRKTSEFPPRNSTLECNASLKSVTSPLEQYPAYSTPGSPEYLELQSDILGTTPTTLELPSTHLNLKSSAVGDIDKPIETGQLAGSSDHAMPTVSERFGSIDPNTNLDNGRGSVPITRSLPKADTVTGGGSVSAPTPNENEIPDQLENDSPPLLDDKMNERLNSLFTQNAPIEYNNNEGDLNTIHTDGGKTFGPRIGIMSSAPSYENKFVDYDFDMIYDYDDESPVEKKEEAGKLAPDIDSLARAADPSNKIEFAYDVGEADYVPPSLLGPTSNDTVTSTTPSPVTTTEVTSATPSPVITTEKVEEYSDIGDADYIPPYLLGSTTNNTEVTTPKVPSRINVASTEARQDETTTTPAAISTETTESDEYGHTVPLPEEDENDGETECKQELPPINRAGRRVSDIKCEEHMNHLKYGIIDRNECLRANGYSQVIGGSQSTEGDFPHMGAVGWSLKDNSWVYLCGSSLISSRFSLTAGHCMALHSRGQIADINGLNPKVVRFGSVSLANNEGAIIMNIIEFIVTEEYSKHLHSKYNDIGLIKFTDDVPISLFLRPACLWDGYLRGHLTGNVTGWGQTQSDQLESKSQQLLHAEIDYFSKDVCFKKLDHRKSRHWKNGLIDSQFCAGKLTGYVDTCQGDSGGPNQVQEPLPMQSNVSMYYVVGITSFGVKCGEPDTPGVYTNVTQYLCWIEKTVWPDEENQMCP